MSVPSLSDIESAGLVLAESSVHLTPLLTSQSISALAPPGTTLAVSRLSPSELSKGVITHSSGNHAQALAIAARSKGVKAYIVMPENSPLPKKRATEGYGAEVIFSPPLAEDRERVCEEVRTRTGAHFIPPYDHYDIITGQGTVALEMVKQAIELGKPLDALVVPIFAAEPELANDCFQGFRSGIRVERVVTTTIADGLRTPVGVRNFAIIKENVEDVITVTERQIVEAQKLVWERMKMVIEPSAAVSLAVVLFSEAWRQRGVRGNVGVVWSGGNVDLDKPMPWTTINE
ncbi:hypothetical protein JAAARDRAFT_34334 [Jaapia argillacea MUCL 33604]|uniref:Tryptophan synthase beta chain-like PALP domain-containing protein n=1 Tax=Jaapia argillacea MUCL 33604 TaxID=933084 RepID=A0A067Q7E6_9AGAM|nr:hypothetical protein JAAARDRAFT_34334 [Jaapia argillacea MUCL 33604]